MLATENATRLLTRISLITRATDEALLAAVALQGEAGDRAGAWLPGITRSLQRVRLECSELHFALRELRDALPSPDTLQPRLLD